MKKSHLRYLAVILLTLLCSLVVHRVETAQPIRNDKFFSFPLVIGDWTGKEVAMSEYVYQGIETPYLFLRNYHSPQHRLPVNLSIVWFDDRNIAFHAPEACMGGVGNQVIEKSRKQITLQGNEYRLDTLIVQMPGQSKQLVWYFFDVDGYITTSQTDIRLHVLKKRLVGKRASASFIRLMAPFTDDQANVEQTLTTFLEALLPLVPQYTYTDMIRI
ncbi:MAG: exosortase C-terminal domain/associated protein EpsI [Syntrophorhabdus sp.]